jgi:hypothetical protein
MKPRTRVSAARRVAESESGQSADPMNPEQRGSAPNLIRSRVRPYLHLHIILGMACFAAVAVHAGARMPASPAGAVHAAFWITALVGVWGALAYWLVPARLSRLERRGALPEDLARERDALLARLFRQASGADPLVKRVLDQALIPYARSITGPVALFLSGRTLAQEQDRVRERVARTPARPDVSRPGAAATPTQVGASTTLAHDLRELTRIAVEIRALPARRVATWLLRAWLPVHILTAAVLAACLLAHILTVPW